MPQDPKNHVTIYNTIKQILIQQYENEFNRVMWNALFNDLSSAHTDLKKYMIAGIPMMIAKRPAAIFYDRLYIILDRIEDYLK